MSIIDYNSPIILQRNVDNDGNPISEGIANEPIVVFRGRGYLAQIPDEFFRVQIDGMTEINIRDEITTENQFKVDYNGRIIFFHENKEGKTINVNYSGQGFIFFSADNIYVRVNSDGDVVETLQDIVSVGSLSYQNPVSDFASLSTTYPNPTVGWAVQTLDNNRVYRWSGSQWVWVLTIINTPLSDSITSNSSVTSASSNAVRLVNDKIGELTDLTTTSQTNIVNAINENRTDINTIETDVIDKVNQVTLNISNSSPTQHIQSVKQNCGVNTTINGATIQNIIFNGNLNYDTDGWTAVNSNLSASDNILSITGGSVSSINGARNTTNISATGGSNYFVRLGYRALNSDVVSIILRIEGTTSGSLDVASVTSPSINVSGELYNRISLSGLVGNLRMYARISYVDSATADGKVVEIQEAMMINLDDIGETETNADQLLSKYQYINSAQSLIHPTVEVRGKNLINLNNFAQGNRETNGTITSNANRISYRNILPVKNSTSYVISGLSTFRFFYAFIDIDGDTIGSFVEYSASFTTPSNCFGIWIVVAQATEISISPIDILSLSLQLEQSSTATSYEPFRGGQIIFPIELSRINTFQDELTYEDSKCNVVRRIEHVIFDGSQNITYHSGLTGYKRFTIPINQTVLSSSPFMIKYDGLIILFGGEQADRITFLSDTSILLRISNDDSGWGQNMSPTPTIAEIQAYFSGWQMNNGTFGTPYDNTGTKTWIPLGDTDNTRAVTTVPTTASPTIEDGTINHQELYYVLQDQIQEEIQPIILGEGVNLVEGQNTMTVKSGFIYEKANPTLSGSTYHINTTTPSSQFNYRASNIISIFKQVENNSNGFTRIDDISNWTLTSTNAFGDESANISQDDFDSNAEYYVLYEVLQEENNNQVQTQNIIYEDNLRGAINEVIETVANNESDLSLIFAILLDLESRITVLEP